MSIGVRASRVRLLDIRQPFRLEANRLLAPDEWPERATYPFCLPQNEPADHLIVAVPCITSRTCSPNSSYLLWQEVSRQEEISILCGCRFLRSFLEYPSDDPALVKMMMGLSCFAQRDMSRHGLHSCQT